MKILIVVLEDFPGGDTRVRRQVAALETAGHEVVVLCAKAYSTESVWSKSKVLRTFTPRKKGGSMSRRLFEYMFFTAEAFLRVFFLSLTFRPSVVQVANMPDFLVVAALPAKLLCKSKIVFDLHDLMPELFNSKANAGPLLKTLMRWQESIGVRLADTVITVNGVCVEILRSRYPKVYPLMIPNAPDPQTFPRLAPRNEFGTSGNFRIGYHGTVARRWGVATIIRSMVLLSKAGLRVTLDVWGGGEELADMEELARQLNVADIVHFHGQTKIDSLVKQLPSIDIAVVPYEPDPYMEIAYATKAFESALMGTPLVVADLRGAREQFSSGAVRFFKPGDPNAMATEIRWLIENPREATEQARLAQSELLARFDWVKISKTYVQTLTS